MKYIIEHSENATNPRIDGEPASHFCFAHKRYNICDESEKFNTNDYSGWAEVEKMLVDERKAFVIKKVSATDHSSFNIYVGEPKCPFDSGTVGFAYMTKEEVIKEFGNDSKKSIAKAEALIKAEVEEFDRYLNGESYEAKILDENENEFDSCGGFDSEESAKEWAEATIASVKKRMGIKN